MTDLEVPDLTDECPAIPAGATGWERQEANRLWRNALHDFHQIAMRATGKYKRLLVIEGAVHDETHGMAVSLLKAEASAAQLDTHLDAIRHRLSLAARED